MRQINFMALMLVPLLLGACAQTSIQPLTKKSFSVTTTAAPACGPDGAQEIANKAAAIEVIRRGGDKFVFAGAGARSNVTGATYSGYGSWSYNVNHTQGLSVLMLDPGDNLYDEALSARELLGPEWELEVAGGIPNTCA